MTYRIAILLFVPSLVVACTRHSRNGSGADSTAMRSAVSDQATVELALSRNGEIVQPQSIQLEQGPNVGLGIAVFRLWIPRDHWHAYQVGIVDGKMILLGGFSSPDLGLAASHLRPLTRQTNSIRDLAAKLAILADDYGGVESHFENEASARPLIDEWRKNAPKDWPTDSVTEVPNMGWRVTATLLSRDSHSYELPWVPVAHVFEFDGAGQLKAWSRRVGPSFVAPVPSTDRK